MNNVDKISFKDLEKIEDKLIETIDKILNDDKKEIELLRELFQVVKEKQKREKEFNKILNIVKDSFE